MQVHVFIHPKFPHTGTVNKQRHALWLIHILVLITHIIVAGQNSQNRMLVFR